MITPGWTCPNCSAENGEAKEVRTTCRACGTARPEILTYAEARELALSIIEGKPVAKDNQPFSYVQAAREFAKFIQNQTRILKVFDEPTATVSDTIPVVSSEVTCGTTEE